MIGIAVLLYCIKNAYLLKKPMKPKKSGDTRNYRGDVRYVKTAGLDLANSQKI